MSTPHPTLPEASRLEAALDAACAKVAPVWPLESFVAVNPYLGLASQDFTQAAETLRRVAGARSTLPTAHYIEALDAGRMTRSDVAAALDERGWGVSVEAFLARARAALGEHEVPSRGAEVATVADVARAVTGSDWPRFVTDRISGWASAYFDEGQALWRPTRGEAGPYAAWLAEAVVDRTPEVMGVARFRRFVSSLPDSPLAAAAEALRLLDVPSAGLDAYLHRLLLRVGGWSAYAARLAWERRLADGGDDPHPRELLAICLVWEAGLLEAFAGPRLHAAWDAARERLGALGASDDIEPGLARDLVLQAAYERACRRRRLASIHEGGAGSRGTHGVASRPRVQAVLCIDVRSEVLRSHLEAADPSIETLGFAGFFGFPIRYLPLGHEASGAHCPVLLEPGYEIAEGIADPAAEQRALAGRRLRHEVERAWQAFKMGAISCFSFVGPVGLAYLPKLFTDGFGLTRPVPPPDSEGIGADAAAARAVRLEPGVHEGRPTGLSLEDRVELARGALTAMSLTKGFARVVLITGHGSTSVNNPHATGLDCGACGGRSGEANARVAAATLNDRAVRAMLAERGIAIPDDTLFVAALHDTTTDEVRIVERGALPASHERDLAYLEQRLAAAGRAARAERAARFALAPSERADSDAVDAAVLARSRDWAQVRPEWGLAGCAAFIVAPRHRTLGVDLEGRCFLHSYDWRADTDFAVLELILTAPMVVASWISLQYYGSTVDPQLFGAGNKTLHNVVGTVGVLEGNGGDLRVGLPWQSVHDGERLQHDPVRLDVIVEAPIEAMTSIVERHEVVRQLVDHGWLALLAMDDRGEVTHHYAGDLRWRRLDAGELREEIARDEELHEPAPALAMVGTSAAHPACAPSTF